MNNFLKEAVRLKELHDEAKRNADFNFYFIKVFSADEEAEKINKIEAQTEYANIVIVRCKKDE